MAKEKDTITRADVGTVKAADIAKSDALSDALAGVKTRLEGERAAVLEKAAPLQKRREELLTKISPLEVELRDVNKQIKEIEQPALRDIGQQLARIARAEGAKTLRNGNEPAPE